MKAIRKVFFVFFVLSITTILAFPTPRVQQTESAWVEKTLAGMTTDEKIGQLIIPAVVGMFLTENSEPFQMISRDITRFHVGGYHMLGEVNILHEPAGVALLLNQMQKLSRLPLLITADFEGGAGIRYIGATRLPRAMAMGATRNEEFAYNAGRVAAAEARAIGVHVNFYPVVDVNNNARNPIINIRSFGSDPQLVSRMARAYIRGSQSAGAMATAKHFPGHGDTSADSHLELPSIDVDRARLDQIELPPFRASVEEGVGGVMSAHIALPRIEAGGLPATLSEKMLTGVLRNELKFDGVIFTDAMNMQGVAAHYETGDAAVRAVKAGADIVLYPPDVEKAFMGIKGAVERGEISEARLDQSVRRVLAAKARYGLDKNRFVDLERLPRALGNSDHQKVARDIIENAITLVRDEKKSLPLNLAPEQKVLFITIVDNADGWRDGVPGRAFLTELRKRHPNTTNVYLSDKTAPAEFDLVRKLAALSDVIIVNGFIRISSFKGSIDMTEGEINLLKHLSKMDKPFAFVLYGSPYLISFVPELPSYILAYEYYPAVEEAALRAVLGEIPFRGRLPVELPGFYDIGHSVTGQYRER